MLNYCSFHVTFKEKSKTKENGRKMFLTNFEKKLMDLIFCADVLDLLKYWAVIHKTS
jgi:hypothetical protein